MKIGDVVFQNYGGLHRYGKVEEVRDNFKGDGWSWAKIYWADDHCYTTCQRWKAKMRNKDRDHFIPKYYRCDDVQIIDLNKTFYKLLKLQNDS
tara:strand:+ start:104 stop:382 length:279 start_codon:yes stop_codon:yes gene_type:complete